MVFIFPLKRDIENTILRDGFSYLSSKLDLNQKFGKVATYRNFCILMATYICVHIFLFFAAERKYNLRIYEHLSIHKVYGT